MRNWRFLHPDPAPAGGGEPSPEPKPGDPVPPAVSFDTKEDFTNEVGRHVTTALAPKLEKLKGYETELEALRPLTEQVAELQRQVAGKQQAGDDQTKIKLEQLTAQLTAMTGQAEAEKDNVTKVQSAWHKSEAAAYIQGLATEAGAAPSAVADIPGLYPSDQVSVTTDDAGKLVVSLTDPEMAGMPHHDQLAAMKAFLESKPHLKAPPPNGAGQGGGAPLGDKPKPFDELTPREQIKAALHGRPEGAQS